MQQFHPLVREWFYSRYPSPTDVQEKAWDAVSGGNHVFVTAPTGSGKTLTAFLWAINTLITDPGEASNPSVLYISPLKALNNDIRKNLIEPVDGITGLFRKHDTPHRKIRIALRSGDTDQKEREYLYRTPPDILITT
ncbi:MAG: DEAD/DEAH box helicase, partial [Spirochaetota bacterium]